MAYLAVADAALLGLVLAARYPIVSRSGWVAFARLGGVLAALVAAGRIVS
ncbi:hypothetical protein RBS60_11110 [Sinomonas sp. ASV486]|nr:hypothetical protein [Sinomonas sp. ASV486]MDQ4490746.1 hypothetical protein [Sinomonas sp. ASV486]